MFQLHELKFFALCVASVATFPCLAFAQLSGDLKFPYQALVLADGANVHSGPGQVHYPTDRLKQGDTVEVYRHDPEGWCAIRPPKNSFSLVPQSTVQVVDEGIGQILEENTQAWVGTGLGPVQKPLWQIKLQKDELVEILGQVNWPDPEGHSTIWYQISPPAGEFRWIQMPNIQLPALTGLNPAIPPRGVVQSFYDLPVDPIRPHRLASASLAEAENARTVRPVQHLSSSIDINRGWRRASVPPGQSLKSRNSTFTDNPASGELPMRTASADLSQLRFADDLNQFGSSTPVRVAAVPTTMPPEIAAVRSADALDDLLTKELLTEPANWSLEKIELGANALYSSTNDSGEQAKIERLISKIENCKKIRDGFRTTKTIGGNGREFGSGLRPSTSDVVLGTNYDAHGWLNEMVRDGGQSQPTYVLQDDNGKITHHIAPAPGLNLHRYLKSKVGIIGQRGYHTRYELDHVTAQQIVELEKSPKRLY